MIVDSKTIKKAKEKLGDRNADLIAELLNVSKWDAHNKKGCCPFHTENTPSFIYNPKGYYFKCFGCGKSVDIIDALIHTGKSYLESCKVLFDEAGVNYPINELYVKTKRAYRYPHEESSLTDDCQVRKYLNVRGISNQTIDSSPVRQDSNNNIAFEYYDSNSVLTMVKYRPARKINKEDGDIKSWCQKDADTSPILWRMDKINPDQPLVITEGEIDCLAVIESGVSNAVSVPLGSQNLHWIEECFDWLEQFNSIIICGDNDEPGVKMRKEAISRLGSWRCKYVNIPDIITDNNGVKRKVKDANEILFFMGKEYLRDLILNADEAEVSTVINVSDIEDIDISDIDGVETGIKELDHTLMRLFYGTLTVISGKPGCVDGETEYFNGNEWKKISEYAVGEKVMQYNSDGTASLVIPERYIKSPCNKFYRMRTASSLDMVLSEEHKVVYKSHGKIHTDSMENIYYRHNNSRSGFLGQIPVSFIYDGNGIDLTDDEIRLMCAVVADGTFNYEISEKAPTYKRCRMNLKREDKKGRIVELLNRCKIPYDVHIYNNTDNQYRNYFFYPPIRAKEFPNEWYNMSAHQKEVFMDEVLRWDGRCGSHKQFFSSSKHNTDFVQFVFASMGYRTTISIDDRRGQKHGNYEYKSIYYTVNITQRRFECASFHNGKQKLPIDTVKSIDGYKYCFTVPSHMLVLRRSGRIFITGNSGKTSLLSQLVCQSLEQDITPFFFSREMPNYLQRNWLYSIMAGPSHMERRETSNGTEYYVIEDSVKKQINNYYSKKWFLYRDDASNKLDDILLSMENCLRKYGCKLFILDNLMTIDIGGDANSELKKQTEAINRLIAFAIKWQASVVLVCHPRKMAQGEDVSTYDISGTANIINLAHRTISLRRINNEKEGSNFNVRLNIIKDRLFGHANKTIDLYYDVPSRRFYTTSEEYNRAYKWESACGIVHKNLNNDNFSSVEEMEKYEDIF